MLKTKYTFTLIAINFLYAIVSVATKFTSQQVFLSGKFLLGLCVVALIMGAYAVSWQQILKRVELASAYMFKGTSLIFVLLFSVLLFGEQITWQNGVGALCIMSGIVIFAQS